MALKLMTSKIYYGWWIVAALFLIALFAGGIVVLGFTAFFEPIVLEFGWSYAAVSLAASLRGAETGLLAPLLGFLTDRWGPRRIVIGGVVICGLGLMLLSRITTLATFYAAFTLVAVGISCVSPTVIYTAVINWFGKSAGTANGIMISGFSLGGLLVPLVVKLIDVFQWRNAFLILGVCIWIILIPVSLLVKDKPRDTISGISYQKDIEKKDLKEVHQATSHLNGSGVKQALQNRAFWHVGIGMALQFLAISAMLVHVMPSLSSIGITRATGSIVATALPLISIIGRFGSGWLGDRYNNKLITMGLFFMGFLGMFLFSFVSGNNAYIIIFSLLFFGIAWGGSAVIRAGLVNSYFGKAHYGTILGFIMGIIAVGSIIGPFMVGWIFDVWGNYRLAWLLCSGFIVVAIIIMATAPKPKLNK